MLFRGRSGRSAGRAREAAAHRRDPRRGKRSGTEKLTGEIRRLHRLMRSKPHMEAFFTSALSPVCVMVSPSGVTGIALNKKACDRCPIQEHRIASAA
jgi:hypothetical protein